MIAAFAAFERTPLSIFVREDLYAYFLLLIVHAWGMAFLIGGGIAVSLRALGVGRQARLERFAVFLPVMWIGAVLAALSGLGLLAGYPAKALTNPVFALKFACLIGAALLVRWLARHAFPAAAASGPLPRATRPIAAAALALWLAGMACGKLLLYTNHMLLAS